jgi:hypothetical protein
VGFNSGVGFTTNGDWLINNADCQTQITNSPTCTLSGNGQIKNGKQSFGGKVTDSRQNWTHVSKSLKLQFKSVTIDSVECNGENGITFSGTGVVRNTKGKKKNSVGVSFVAFVQDNGKGRKNRDLYYFRAFTDDGTTLLLVSANPSDPNAVAPVTISSGNLTVRSQ